MTDGLTPDQGRVPMRRQGRRKLEDRLAAAIAQAGLPTPIREHRFHKFRLWRFDFAWPEVLLAVEVEGGIYSGGRHTRGAGFERDLEKYNAATLAGWRVLRLSGGMIRSGYALRAITVALNPRGGAPGP